MNDAKNIEDFGHERRFIFVADSSKRDPASHPTPGEYAVTFNAPFKNVTRFEIMEATIPRTDYTLDSRENTLTYALAAPTNINSWKSEIEGLVRTATFTPGDYNLPQLVAHMNDVLAEVAAANEDPAQLVVRPTTVPSEISNKIRIECSVPFCILGDDSAIRNTLGLGDPVSALDPGYRAVPGYTINYPNGASGVFVAVAGELDNGDTSPVFVGPLPADLGAYEGVYGSRRVQQHFIAAEAGTPVLVLAFLSLVGNPVSPSVAVSVRKASDGSVVAAGTVDATGSDYVPARCMLAAVDRYVAGEEYYVEFTSTTASPTDHVAVWYGTRNLPPNGSYAAVDSVEVHPGEDFCVDVLVGAFGYGVAPPGIVNLVGCKYIKIRCLELEQFLDRDRVGEPSTAGMGMVALVGYGFQNQRYNFVHYPPSKFRPMTVQKLTFRLERPDGSPYDTQGVDNHMLCAITFVDRPRELPDRPEYHPGALDYDPSYINFQLNKWKTEADAMYEHKKRGFRRR